MASRPDETVLDRRPARWLRLLKLLLTVILLAIAVWRALVGPLPS